MQHTMTDTTDPQPEGANGWIVSCNLQWRLPPGARETWLEKDPTHAHVLKLHHLQSTSTLQYISTHLAMTRERVHVQRIPAILALYALYGQTAAAGVWILGPVFRIALQVVLVLLHSQRGSQKWMQCQRSDYNCAGEREWAYVCREMEGGRGC